VTRGPALVLVPDADARVDPGLPVLGVAPGLRLADAARRAGFAAVYVLPGTRTSPPGACPGSAGDHLDTAALVVIESAAIEPAALQRLLHARGEGSLLDERGRPVAWWSDRLARLPAGLPVSEALASPEAPSSAEVARLVDAEDRPRMEALIVRATAAEGPESTADAAPPSPWRRWLELPLLRWLCARRRPPGQIEVGALLLAVLSGVAALLASGPGLVLAAALLLIGVQLAALLPELRRLLAAGGGARAGWLTPAIRPFGHASLAAALTYRLVAEVGRTGVADLVLLVLGGAAALLSLAQARAVLRRSSAAPFELPSLEGLAAQLEVSLPARLRTPVRAEILVFILAWVGPGWPWGVLVAVGLARLWRWFIGHPDASGH
jgi:hypothetical protein